MTREVKMKKISCVLSASLVLVIILFAVTGFSQNKVNIFISTGPTTGVTYAMGGGMADILTKHVPNLNATAGTTDGSMANLLLIKQGKADLGLCMGDATWDAYKGQNKFQGKQVDVRALMVLYPNRMHVVTIEGTGINKMADLKGKRVSTGAPNSATQIMAHRVMEAYGINPEKDIIHERLDPGKSAEAIKDRKLDAFFWVGGVPSAAVTDLAATPGIKLKLIDNAEATDAMVSKYGPIYAKFSIAAKSYPGQETPNQIVSVWNVMVADAKLPNQVAYDIVKTIFEHKQEMIRAHAESRNFELEYQTPSRAVIPFHPGAKKYFDEKGVKTN
jgi:TRAP transporter TAXI family solute receptor